MSAEERPLDPLRVHAEALADLDRQIQIEKRATPGPWERDWAFSTHFVVPAAAGTVAAGLRGNCRARTTRGGLNG